ncbi:MAG: patatin-like phospholipase family protein [Candidatus Methylomirabilis oxyfera]|nr:patatin-like phospholipase family protein [Candidatus Methylomirabilis oxyfera]
MGTQKIFGVLEGGGVRGIAHAGAYEAVSRTAQCEFAGIAGTSAGSIVAALIAAGASPEFIKQLLLSTDFREFLDPECRDVNIATARTLVEGLLNEGMLGRAMTITFALFSNDSLVTRLISGNGIHSGAPFVAWFRGALQDCCGNAELRFRDIAGKHLKVIATNLTTRSLTVFSSELTPDLTLWEAVRASISVPFFFTPFKIGSGLFIDGGLLSNCPVWVFDDERHAFPSAPTVGFRLREPTPQPREPVSFVDFVSSFCETLWNTARDENDLRQNRDIPALIMINLLADELDWLAFDIDGNTKQQIYDNAVRVTAEALSRELRPVAKASNGKGVFRRVAEEIFVVSRMNGRFRKRGETGTGLSRAA